MSRSKRFITGLLSSYAAIGVNILYTVASVPLALHYLDKEEFGLWALVTQLSGYLMLLEFGMRGSVARSLSDHKDHMEDGVYGSVLRTGARVFAIQGGCVVVLGLAMAWLAPPLLGLPPRLHHIFTVLMVAQAILGGLGLSIGALASPLWCHQRLDISNVSGSISLIATFAALWIGFHLGWHLYSLTVSTTVGFLVGVIITYFTCSRLGFYPSKANRGRYDPQLFRELFHFGSGLFLMNLGAQLASASQVILISRLLGIEAAATWSISTKVFGMAQQFVAKIFDSSVGGLTEMLVRGENLRLHGRFRDLVSISAVMAVAASAGITLVNGAFVEIWTSGKVTWNPWNNYLLACVLFSTAITRCHTSLVGVTKHIRGMKFVYLVEGIAFIVLSICLVPTIGFSGLLMAALFCNIGITGSYGVGRTADYFKVSRIAVTKWIIRPAGILLLTALIFSLTRVAGLAVLSAISRFIIGVGAFFGVVVPALWFFGVNQELRHEIGSLVSKILGNFTARFGRS